VWWLAYQGLADTFMLIVIYFEKTSATGLVTR
jgi:hypothetical protein